MSSGVQNNIALLNASNQYKVNTGKKSKSSEKLASGYKLNRSADDAAGLAISEKMRWQIRGLDQGAQNAQDGISWVQTGDGALNEVHALLQRMRELTIQSLNDTNTEADRAACQAEFDALQSEIDRITGDTQFNTQNIFDQHELPYYQCEGNVNWPQDEKHIVADGRNELTITYRSTEADAEQSVTIEVPAGSYTTQELIDEIEDAMFDKRPDSEGFCVEFTQFGTCNLNFEGGEVIDAIGGGLSYLFYDMYEGGGFGALIGTTVFENETVRLEIRNPNNNYMEFMIEDFNGNSNKVQISIPNGEYNRQQLIDTLNQELQGKNVTAVAYGTGIKLQGEDCIVTGFKGNMFKIDEGSKIYHSVFYDNVNYGNITMDAAYFKGGAVKPVADSNSEEFHKFVITSTNNQLVLKPNGADAPTALTITEGEYTVDGMRDELNRLLTANNLADDLVVSAFTDPYGYMGLQITSKIEGVTSDVGIDSTSSAYETLFIKKEYNSVSPVYAQSDPNTDRDAYVWGAKDLSSGITIDATNDKFNILIKKGNDIDNVSITLSHGANVPLSTIQSELETQLSGKGVRVETANGYLKIVGEPASGITEILAEEESGNKGYKDIFVKETEKKTYESKSDTTVELLIPQTGIDSGNNELNITVGGIADKVTLPTGNPPDKDAIINAIEGKFQEQTELIPNKFTDVDGKGKSTDRNFNLKANGTTTPETYSFSNTGTAVAIEGRPGVYENNVPAQVTMKYAVPESVTIDDSCNKLQLNIKKGNKDQEITVTIENGTYSRNELVGKVQQAVDDAFGVYYGGAEVSLDAENKLVFTARTEESDGYKQPGINTSISCSTSTSSFLRKLHTIEKPAVFTSPENVLSNIVIGNSNNTFEFYLNEQKVSVKLREGIYATPKTLADELNRVLSSYNVESEISGTGKLVLKTKEVGAGVSIRYDSENGGSSSLAIFGDLTKKSPAEIMPNQIVQQEITIADNTNQFVITVNGKQETITLLNGKYDRSSFLNMLKGCLSGKGVTASYSGNKLKLTTEKTGDEATLKMTYATGGSSMVAIYGETEKITPGINARFDGDNLVLEGTRGGTIITVASGDNSLLQPKVQTIETEPSKGKGYSSTKYSSITGRKLTEQTITIDEYNNQLTFYYNENGTANQISFELEKKGYSPAELVNALQEKINTALGDNSKLTVKLTDDNRIKIEANAAGNKYTMGNFSGDFYNKIIGTTRKYTSEAKPTIKYGSQTNDLAYTVGRKDVRNQTTLIRDNVNDILMLDFTHGGQMLSFKMELDAGEYSGDALVAEIQKKLNEQLVANHLAENLIEVGIGGVSTGVTGSNDQNALVFKLSDSVKLPAEGEYIIDGVRGNAAFSVFYQTDGELEPAYMGGTKDISNGVTIKENETLLSFKVDGTKYEIDIPAKEYTAEEIVTTINDLLKNKGIPAVAENYKDTIRLTYPSLGKHTISEVRGSAKEEVFFQENGEVGDRTGIMIQMSSNAEDSMEIDRPIVNTSFLGINSVAITRPKYANKALQRLDSALARVSEIRSNFGATQNRLEHGVNNNQNTSENTQAAESRIRDTDMATEMMENAKYSILQQATESIMAQQKIQAQNILKLLQS